MNKVTTSLLIEDVEDALISILEEGGKLPPELVITYPVKEYEIIEKYHRFRCFPDKNLRGFTKQRYETIRLFLMDVDVTIKPEENGELNNEQ